MVKEGIEECGLSKAQGFSQGGCVCFSDSSQAPADRHWKSNWGKKCAGRSDERKRRRRRKKGGGGIWDSYLIKCCFRGNLEIFFRDSSALHPAADFKSPTLGHTDCEAFWGCQGTGRVTG